MSRGDKPLCEDSVAWLRLFARTLGNARRSNSEFEQYLIYQLCRGPNYDMDFKRYQRERPPIPTVSTSMGDDEEKAS